MSLYLTPAERDREKEAMEREVLRRLMTEPASFAALRDYGADWFEWPQHAAVYEALVGAYARAEAAFYELEPADLLEALRAADLVADDPADPGETAYRRPEWTGRGETFVFARLPRRFFLGLAEGAPGYYAGDGKG